MTQTEASIDALVAEIRAGLDGVTEGPWEVIEERHPWMLPAEPQRGRLADKNGEHIERRIFTTWQDAQLKSGIPVVNLSVGLGAEPRQPIHMVHMESADAAHIARMSPDNITLILDALEASEARATRMRDVLRLCVDALNESDPIHDDYWAAAKAGEDALSSSDPDGALESAEALVREARDVLGRLFRHAPDMGVDEFHDALRDAHLLMAKIDGAE